MPLDIYGVRYPDARSGCCADYGARYHGWIANASAPDAFAKHLATVHIPRRYYTQLLPGIPTIRVFEALACGIPLVSAPWSDSEGLFRVGEDFLMVSNGEEMARTLPRLKDDPELEKAWSRRAWRPSASVTAARTASEELMRIYAGLRATGEAVAA